jgi:hypothetical protein
MQGTFESRLLVWKKKKKFSFNWIIYGNRIMNLFLLFNNKLNNF